MFFKKITASSSVFNANIKLLFSAFTFEALFPFEFLGKMYITAKPALTILHIWKAASILYWPLYDGWPRITVFSVGELPWVLACVQTSPPPSGKNRRKRRGRLYTGYGCQPFFFSCCLSLRRKLSGETKPRSWLAGKKPARHDRCLAVQFSPQNNKKKKPLVPRVLENDLVHVFETSEVFIILLACATRSRNPLQWPLWITGY